MTVPFSPVRAILRKREGAEHPPGEIESIIAGFLDGTVADYQMTAWMMAVLFRGMSREETARLTRTMIRSGDTLPPWGEGGPVVDKHSTGGVGDKVSLVIAPLAAACGLRVPMISGRSLGHTGGTLDKLESIPGYKVALDLETFRAIVNRVGTSIAGATDSLVPADRRMYALRDVSGIVESPSLIVSSILSKKASTRLDGLVLDVKIGNGGFMVRPRDARRLAEMLVEASVDLGMRAEALLTRMGEPLGRTVGNSLEVREAVEFLRGENVRGDLEEICLDTVSAMLRVGEGGATASMRGRAEAAWRSGRGLELFAKMIEAHGGDPRITQDTRLLPRAPHIRVVTASDAGWVRGIDARRIGELVIDLGGGRRRADERIDPRVGIEFSTVRGQRVEAGQPLARLHLSSEHTAGAFEGRLRDCYRITEGRPKSRRLIVDRLVGSP